LFAAVLFAARRLRTEKQTLNFCSRFRAGVDDLLSLPVQKPVCSGRRAVTKLRLRTFVRASSIRKIILKRTLAHFAVFCLGLIFRADLGLRSRTRNFLLSRRRASAFDHKRRSSVHRRVQWGELESH